MSALPARPIPEYPPLQCPEDWERFLRISRAMLERLAVGALGRSEPEPEPEVFQAVAHLVKTLAPEHFRHLH